MSNNSYSIKKLSKETIEQFVNSLKVYEVKNTNNLIYKRFNYLDKLVISVYKSNSVLIQLTKLASPTDLDQFIKQYCFWADESKNKSSDNKASNSKVSKTSPNKKKTKSTTDQNKFLEGDTIGCDEVGVGEYLGPIVTCCALVKQDQIDLVKKLGVKDSKLLSDEKIIEIANELKKFIKFQIFCFNPKKGALEFNQMYDRLKNINALKAYMHNQCLIFFKQKYQINNLIVLDQFVDPNKYYLHLTNFNVEPIIKINLMEEKAESKYLSVAVASILARAFYLELCQKLLNKINYKDDYKKMLGADNKTFERIKKHILAHPNFDWRKFFKVFFKPFAKFLESLED
ncbi:ribonuclease HIII [Mycoplasma tullyi]|uniref:Ribonuclease n=1 Tax=Mycoplasma tullyi TaxID=1612150 RepID=A0A7D7U4Z3_9MOLU|nr:ribonuclease HIII [Mycoplasma tullyi]QMT98248.1 ribonuclease HIII [Mycoplasma tullyi]